MPNYYLGDADMWMWIWLIVGALMGVTGTLATQLFCIRFLSDVPGEYPLTPQPGWPPAE